VLVALVVEAAEDLELELLLAALEALIQEEALVGVVLEAAMVALEDLALLY
jgi:hypothetical protein